MLASDDASGLSHVTVEARRHGDDAWRTLAIERAAGLAVVLDDDVLPEGTYRLRAHAIDTVGNERTISAWPDGRPAEVRLPYRLATRLTVGRQVRTESGTKLDRRPLIGTGDPVILRGKAVDASGNGRGSVAITVSERISATGAVWRPIATIRTDRTGAFAYKAPRGPARTVRFEYAATPTSLSASAAVELRVRGGHLDRRRPSAASERGDDRAARAPEGPRKCRRPGSS